MGYLLTIAKAMKPDHRITLPTQHISGYRCVDMIIRPIHRLRAIGEMAAPGEFIRLLPFRAAKVYWIPCALVHFFPFEIGCQHLGIFQFFQVCAANIGIYNNKVGVFPFLKTAGDITDTKLFRTVNGVSLQALI